MSLFRQLWLAVILVTLTSFTGSLAISLLSTRSYLEQQLHRKNVDSANSLAYSISQLSKDPVTIGLQIAALFDTGQYETISITSPDGKVIAERVQDRVEISVPEWFIDLFPISAEAGKAQISDTLLHFGVIKVVSHAQLAYQALWDEAETLLIWFLGAAMVCVLIGMLILQRINKPLAAMVQQAEAITERRFLTISEPSIPELRSVARATNDMVRRLHNRAIEEAARLETLQKQMNYDPVTGLAKREYFINRLSQILSGADEIHAEDREDVTSGELTKGVTPAESSVATAALADAEIISSVEDGQPVPREVGDSGKDNKREVPSTFSELIVANEGKPSAMEAAPVKRPQRGILVLIRINNLEEINRELGRTEANNLLHQVGSLLVGITADSADSAGSAGLSGSAGKSSVPLAARLNGSDFVLLIPDVEDAAKVANRLTKELAALPSRPSRDGGKIADFCHIGAVRYQRGDTLSELLARADTALATAEQTGANAWHVSAAQPQQSPAPMLNIGDWRHIFSDALAADRFKLVPYPVIGHTGATLHQEAVARMQAQRDGGWLDASDFVNIAARLNLTGPLDLTIIRHALEFLRANNTGELAINLSIETVADWDIRSRIEELLRQNHELCQRLWIEVPEYGAVRRFEVFRDFCRTFKQLGCRVGIEDFGRHFEEIEKLAGLGLDYLKIDASFVHGINQNKGNQKFLKGLCKTAHNMSIIVIALGVQNEAERKALIRLGVDGLTGPGVK